jgi:DNA-binding NarL/FixJ family response regulator
MNLLIVDDHPGARALIRELTAQRGDTVCECGTGEAALAAVGAFVPDWITIDLLMPGMNGFAALRELHRVCPTARLVVVSSYDDPESQKEAAALGAVAFVVKDELMRLPLLLATAPTAFTA